MGDNEIDHTAVLQGLTTFQRDALVAIAKLDEDEPPHGLGIKSEMEDWYQEEQNHGKIYPSLSDLEKKGYVEIGEKDDRTNSYALTEKGYEAAYADAEMRLETLNQA